MLIVGVDPSLTSTGLAAVRAEGTDIGVSDVGIVRTTNDVSVIERTGHLYRSVRSFYIKNKPDLVVVEMIRVSGKIMAKNADSTSKVIRAQQVAITAAQVLGLPVVEVEATKWRRVIGCNRQRSADSKRAVREFINARFEDSFLDLGITHSSGTPLFLDMPGVNASNTDIADAIGIAMYGKTV